MTNSTSVGRGRLRARLALLSVTTALASGLSAPAVAQSTPERPVIDGRGVDVATGEVGVAGPAVSTGSAQFNQGWQGKVYRNPLLSYILAAGADRIVYIAGVSKRFISNGSGGYVAADGDGSTFVRLAGTNDYIYTTADGTEYSFKNQPFTGIVLGRPGTASLVEVKHPDGRRDEYRYKSVRDTQFIGTKPVYTHYFRLQAIVQGERYLIKPTYASNTTDADFYKLLSVKTIDLSVEHCNRFADTCTGLTQAWPTVTRSETAVGGTTSTTLTDPAGNATVVQTDANGVTDVTPAAGAATDVTYDGTGKVSALVDAGVTTTYAYVDAGGQRTTTATTAGASKTYVTDLTSSRLVSTTDETGRTTSYQYDASGRRTRETKPEGNYTQWTYDARGNVTETRQVAKPGSGLADIVTSASFDATCTNALTCNQPNYTIDARGNRTDFTYDGTHGGLTQVLRPAATSGGTRPRIDYVYATLYPQARDASGALVASTTPEYKVSQITTCATVATCAGSANETKVTFAYNSPTRQLTARTVAAGDGSIAATEAFTYDLLGNVASIDGPLPGAGDTTYYFYNANRDLRGLISPDPGTGKRRAVRHTYDAARRRTKTQVGTATGTALADLTGMTVLQEVATGYDANGNPSSEALIAGGTTYAVTQYAFDAFNRLECAVQRMNPAIFSSLPSSACSLGTAGSAGPDRIVKTSYDAAGRVLKTQSAYGTSEQSDDVIGTYSNNGQLVSLIDAENNKTTYEYDGHDRLLQTRFPISTQGASTSSATDYEQYGYDASGLVTSRRLRDGQLIEFTYDGLGQLVEKDLPGSEPDVTYTYDLLGRLTVASTSAQSLQFSYDALGRNRTQTGPLGTISSEFDPAGRRTRLTWADGFYVTYDYLLTGEMLSIRENGAVSGIGVLAAFGYDDLGQRQSLTRGNGTVSTYASDPVSRLTTLVQDLAASADDLSLGFTYHSASQIDSTSRSSDAYAWAGHYNRNTGYSLNGLNQATAAGPTVIGYDARGNVSSIGGSGYTYSSENLLLTGPSSGSLSYDPLSRLVQASGTLITRFQYDGLNMIGEFDVSNVLQRRYVFGPGLDEPLVWYEGSSTSDRRWLHADERGSIVAVTNSAGTRTAIGAYDEFGVPAATNIGRFGYTGQAWFPELDLWYYKARVYAPTLGRFMQTDPAGYGDGFGWYGYVGGDPINLSDYLGLEAGDVIARYKPCAAGYHRETRGQDYHPCVPNGASPTIGLNPAGGTSNGGRVQGGGKPQNAQCAAPLSSAVGSARAVLEAATLGADIATIGLAAGGITGPAAVGTIAMKWVFEAGLGAVNLYDGYANGNWASLQAQGAGIGARLIPGGRALQSGLVAARGPTGILRNSAGQFRSSYLKNPGIKEAGDLATGKLVEGAVGSIACGTRR